MTTFDHTIALIKVKVWVLRNAKYMTMEVAG
jgi:hypothetical protein